MRIILDQNFPRPVARALVGYSITTAYELGWAELTNGALLAAAEAAGFELMLTADRNLAHQQRLAGRRIALVVTSLNSQTALLQHIDLVKAAIERAMPGSYEEVEIPRTPLIRTPWPKPQPD